MEWKNATKEMVKTLFVVTAYKVVLQNTASIGIVKINQKLLKKIV